MNILETIQGIIKPVSKIVDDVVTTKEEKGKIIEKINDAENELEQFINNQVTSRHQTDMKSDSNLSKNIRPLILIFLMSSFFVLSLLNGLEIIKIEKAFTDMLSSWGSVALMFYFGSRGFEKVTSISGNLFKKRRDK